MTTEQAMINDAFERHLTSYLSRAAEQAITREHGPEAFAQVQAAYLELMHCPVDWKTATIDTALPVLEELLARRYPWLTAKARSNLYRAFIMEWK